MQVIWQLNPNWLRLTVGVIISLNTVGLQMTLNVKEMEVIVGFWMVAAEITRNDWAKINSVGRKFTCQLFFISYPV